MLVITIIQRVCEERLVHWNI